MTIKKELSNPFQTLIKEFLFFSKIMELLRIFPRCGMNAFQRAFMSRKSIVVPWLVELPQSLHGRYG